MCQATKQTWVCRRCGAEMKRNRYGWFDHVRGTACECQHADYITVERTGIPCRCDRCGHIGWDVDGQRCGVCGFCTGTMRATA